MEHERPTKWVHPTWQRKPVWTLRRKVMGNLLPSLFAVPFVAYGCWWMYSHGVMGGAGLLYVAGGPIAGWIAVNFLGLYQNRAMRKEMTLRLRSAMDQPPYRRYFVGAATPAFRGLLDPHEDIGFILLHPDRVEFFGEKLHVNLSKAEVTHIRVRPNVHSMVGLGRWVSIEAVVNGKEGRLMLEIRERPTLLGNLRMSRTLLKKLQKWKASG